MHLHKWLVVCVQCQGPTFESNLTENSISLVVVVPVCMLVCMCVGRRSAIHEVDNASSQFRMPGLSHQFHTAKC